MSYDQKAIDNHIRKNLRSDSDIEGLMNMYATYLQELDKFDGCRAEYGYTYYTEQADRLRVNAEVRGFNVINVLWAAVASAFLNFLDHPNNPRFQTQC